MPRMRLACMLGAGLLCVGALQAATGDNCGNPIVVTLPAALPFADLNQHTCGRLNDYDDPNTCLFAYAGGEDIIYRLQVTATVDIEIEMDPHQQDYTAMVLSQNCPPVGAQCLALCADEYSTVRRIECRRLTPGTYTLMVDCCPAPGITCISSFDLRINGCVCTLGACCVDSVCIGTLTESQCVAQTGRWFEGFDCAPFACPTELTTPETCATAYPIPGALFSAEFANTGATADGPPGSCNKPGALVLQNDAWFTYSPVSDCTLALEIQYYSYNGQTVIYSGSDCDELTELYCLNSGLAGNPDRDSILFAAAAGTTYWVQIGRWGSQTSPAGETLLALHCAASGLRGDANCDGQIGFGDINPFVLLLSNPSGWQITFPGCPRSNGDINGDGTADFGDINPFVSLLSGGG